MIVDKPPDQRGEWWVKCTPCDHAWIGAYLPMEVSTLAALMQHARCPKCGGAKLFMATTADIEKAGGGR
jgi:hypothetical protein